MRFLEIVCVLVALRFSEGEILLIFRFFAHHHFILITCSLSVLHSLYSHLAYSRFLAAVFRFACNRINHPCTVYTMFSFRVCGCMYGSRASIREKNRFLACFSPKPKTRTHMDIEFGETHPILKCHRDYIDDKDTAIIARHRISLFRTSWANIVWIARCSGLVKLMQPEKWKYTNTIYGDLWIDAAIEMLHTKATKVADRL